LDLVSEAKMKTMAATVVVILGLTLLPPPSSLLPAHAADITAEELLLKVDDLWRGESSYSEMTMDVVTENWERSLTMKGWSLGKDHSLIVITYPPKERGVATLKVNEEMWNYLPRVNRVIKVPSSMMMAGWMGSHFTNDDLVKESRLSEDYDYEITFQGQRNGVEIYELTLVPRPDAPVVWGKIVMTITTSDLMPIEGLYYDEDGYLARTMVFSHVKEMAGRMVPSVLTLVPADEPGEKTVITYGTLDLGQDIDESFFSRKTLQRKDLAR
jgi:outer membrane lipoprotein-sorting protein